MPRREVSGQTESATLRLARELIARRSVTPDDAGCLELVAARLAPVGFDCERIDVGGVSNLWARRGREAPGLAFVGHTDVVPPGDETTWRHPPFAGVVADGQLWGRGACDMKGAVAAFVGAAERFARAHPSHAGSIAVVLTSDEEGPSVDGTVRVVEALARRGERVDLALVGEPTSAKVLGDAIRVGRRGSLTGRLTVHGIQGHVAYPEQVSNPIHKAATALDRLAGEVWDHGTDVFPPTSFQVASIRAGTGASNVVPARCECVVNFRYSTAVTADELMRRAEAILAGTGARFDAMWERSAEPFATTGGPLLAAVEASVLELVGRPSLRSTAGGTSDGRFFAPLGTEVVELGLVNATIHQVDERVDAADVDRLSAIYERILERLFERFVDTQ